MDNQQLNNAFDAFAPTQEQRQRMFANIMEQKDAPVGRVVRWSKVYIPASCVAAAALVIVLAGGLFGADTPVPVADNTMLHNNSIVENTDKQTAVKSGTGDSIDIIQADKTADVAPVAVAKPDKETKVSYKAPENKVEKTTVAQTPDAPVAEVAPQTAGIQPAEQTQSNDSAHEQVFTAVIEQQQSVSDQVQEVEPIVPGSVTEYVLNINNVSPARRSMDVDSGAQAPMMAAFTMMEPEADSETDDGHASSGGGGSASGHDVTYEQFCSGIGTDVRKVVDVPNDMTDITDMQKYAVGAPEDWNVVYQGNDDRIIDICISTDIESADEFIQNSGMEKSSFGDSTAVVMHDGTCYTAYFCADNVAYTVSTNITETEVADLIASIIG